MKAERHAKILEIIKEHAVETQEDLTLHLRQHGFTATQATVSRDINELGLVKVAYGNGKKSSKYKYALNAVGASSDSKVSDKYRTILAQTLTKVDRAKNIVVVKTFSGMAQGAAAAVDAFDAEHVVGSVAGDDTIIIVMRSDEEAERFCALLDDLKKAHNA